MMTDNRFELLKQVRQSYPFSPLVDAAALGFAHECRQRLATNLGLAMTWGQWSRLTAILQIEFAVAIRHATFETPPFPCAAGNTEPDEGGSDAV